MLTKAITLAQRVHAGQHDAGGNPYIFHPMRVMLACSNEQEQICAVLHDVVEHGDCTLEDLQRAGFAEEIISGVAALSKDSGEDYETYINRLRENPLALQVKLADLCDNTHLQTALLPKKKARNRLKKYRRAAKTLLNFLRVQNAGLLVFDLPAGDYGRRLKEFITQLS